MDLFQDNLCNYTEDFHCPSISIHHKFIVNKFLFFLLSEIPEQSLSFKKNMTYNFNIAHFKLYLRLTSVFVLNRAFAKSLMPLSTWAAGFWRRSWKVCSLYCISRYSFSTHWLKYCRDALSEPDDPRHPTDTHERWKVEQNAYNVLSLSVKWLTGIKEMLV